MNTVLVLTAHVGLEKTRNRGAPNYLCFVTVILVLNSEICFLSYIEVCVNTVFISPVCFNLKVPGRRGNQPFPRRP